jgi:hypothetical protein
VGLDRFPDINSAKWDEVFNNQPIGRVARFSLKQADKKPFKYANCKQIQSIQAAGYLCTVYRYYLGVKIEQRNC